MSFSRAASSRETEAVKLTGKLGPAGFIASRFFESGKAKTTGGEPVACSNVANATGV
jgi:hypothetical protein